MTAAEFRHQPPQSLDIDDRKSLKCFNFPIVTRSTSSRLPAHYRAMSTGIDRAFSRRPDHLASFGGFNGFVYALSISSLA